jgi:predicted TIM-barrel fold metal-dependent hydrolase
MSVTDSKPDADTRRSGLTDMFIVDGDIHVHESPAELAEYATDPWDVALREIAKIPERYMDLPGLSPNADFGIPFPGGAERTMFVTTATEMREKLTELHIDRGVLFPDHLLMLAKLPNADWATTLARAYNNWLEERWLGEEPSLLGAIVVAPQDPAGSAADIRHHAGRTGWCCIYLPACAVRPLYGHRQYDPIYEAACELGLPVILHSVTTVHPTFPFELDAFETTLARHAVAHPFSMISNLTSMMETGVFVRFPELRIGVMEAGISWMPFLMQRLDKEFSEQRRAIPFLKERPSHYLREVYVGSQPIEEPEDRRDVLKIMELFDGDNKVVFASDWPHHDFDHPQFVSGYPFTDETRKNLMGLNAARLFGLDVPEGPYV